MEFYMKENILILAKTYPSPSEKYLETSCVAGITDTGAMRRLFPIPFRRLFEEQKFQKWQWIEAETLKSPQDHRNESRRINFDKIILKEKIDTRNNWEKRMPLIQQIPAIKLFLPEGKTPVVDEGVTLAVFSPDLPVRLEIAESAKEWTEEQLSKLRQLEGDDVLFPEDLRIPKAQLEKIPYDFYYVLNVETTTGERRDIRIKIIDWEVCELFRNCVKNSGAHWEKPFRNKMEKEMNGKNLKLLLGNIHRFPKTWLIVSLIYPPKQSAAMERQSVLF